MPTHIVPDDHATIADAISDPICDRILIAPGTYGGGISLSATVIDKTLVGNGPGVIFTGTVTTGGTGGLYICGLENLTLQAGLNVGGGTLRTQMSDCTLSGTGGSSSCIAASSGSLIMTDCTISTAASFGISALSTAGDITIRGTNTVGRSSGTGTAALHVLNGRTMTIDGSVDVTGLWTNAMNIEATGGFILGSGSVTASTQTVTTGINVQAGSIEFNEFVFVGSSAASGTGIRCSAGAVEITGTGSLDRTQRGIHASGSGSIVTVNRMSIGATTGHNHGVFAETSSNVNLYGCTIENCVGQTGLDGSACHIVTGADVVFDSKDSVDDETTIVNRIENCTSFTNQDGGAIHVNGSGTTLTAYALRIVNCATLGTGSGGAVRAEAGAVVNLGRLLNETDGDTGEDGAVSYAGWDAFDSGRVDQGGVTIELCEALDGGAISADASTVNVVNARLRANHARRT